MTERRPDWVAVASYAREEEARLVAGRLRSEGVEAQVYPEQQAGAYEGLQAMRRPYDVLVPTHREMEARALLERLRTE